MGAILYAIGDATQVPRLEPCVIAHIVNDVGAWGRGFTAPLESRYPGQAAIYRRWARGQEFDARGVPVPFGLGRIYVAHTQLPNVDGRTCYATPARDRPDPSCRPGASGDR